MPTLYHWALVATEKGETLTSGPVQMFHIVTQKEGYLGEDGYMESPLLLCVLPLPDLKTTMSDLKQSCICSHPRRWGCSQWALRAIKALIEADMVVTRAKNSFFTETAANRDFWGPMLHVAASKCGHDSIVARNTEGKLDGIRMMSFAPSGIVL
ncbi:hypothetical protein BKA70DRAFT_1288035 [Coprinopsis sp. MPI-PUGE-AT-0042]|nr:hypothetical protein BKA70DRAFT_1288035 [Coprinopsis sp. MPI-PUGE-AT-0042]